MTQRKEIHKQLRDAEELPMGSRGSSTMRCYKVQARMSIGCGPLEIRGAKTLIGKNIITDSRWETLNFPEAAIGVPASKWKVEYADHGYLSYPAAQALRWWLLAEQYSITGLETRLVEFQFKSSYEAIPVKAHCLVDPEQREDILPDWGKDEQK